MTSSRASEPSSDWAELERLLKIGLSPAEAIDYHATRQQDYSAAEWATVRGTSRQAVNRNAKEGERQLSDVEEVCGHEHD